MKGTYLISVIILLAIIAGCGGNKQSTDDLIVVNVTKSYPKKELALHDLFDVEYVPLETNDEFVTTAYTQAIGKEIILDRTRSDIFIFDSNGKGLRKINRMGQGPEEYISITGQIALDEDNNEIFVNSFSTKTIFVYDLFGNFKRSFVHKGDSVNAEYAQIDIFDKDNLICHDSGNNYYNREDGTFDTTTRNIFWIISKQDGSVTKEIDIPYTKRIFTRLIYNDNGRRGTILMRINHLIPYHDSWLVVEPSSDTIYRYLPDHSMIPFIVRTPSIQSMDPEIFLFPGVLTDRYFFMHVAKKEYDFEKQEFLSTDLMYDKQEQALFETVVYNDDFSTKRPVNMWHEILVTTLINSEEIAFVEKLEAYQLVEAYEKGQLKGKLKEIAAELDEEDNPVIMIAKNKK